MFPNRLKFALGFVLHYQGTLRIFMMFIVRKMMNSASCLFNPNNQSAAKSPVQNIGPLNVFIKE